MPGSREGQARQNRREREAFSMMKRFHVPAASYVFATVALGPALIPAVAQQPGQTSPVFAPQQPGGRSLGRASAPPAIQPKPEEMAKVREKTEQIEALVKDLKAKHANPELVGDVE